MPHPLSATVSVTEPVPLLMPTVIREGSPCFTALVNASCTIR